MLLLALAACGAPGDTPSASSTAPFDATTAPAPSDDALAAIDSVALRTHIAELASDAYGGRGTGTPGEQMTVDYIIGQFEALGLEGGMPDGSFTQDVPLRSLRVTDATPLTFTPAEGGAASFEFIEDAALGTDTDASSISLDGEELVTDALLILADESEDETDRCSAAEVLGAMGRPDVVPRLQDLLREQGRRIRMAIGAAIDSLDAHKPRVTRRA